MNFQKRWSEFYPNAKVVTYPDAGHYLIEDKPIEIQNEIEIFLKSNQ